MTLLENNHDSIFDYLNSLSDLEIVSLWNTYCQENSYEDEIYSNDEEFFELFYSGVSPLKALQDAFHGDYRYTDNYVMFNGYGNLESTDEPRDSIDYEYLIDAILESPKTYDIELEEE